MSYFKIRGGWTIMTGQNKIFNHQFFLLMFFILF